MSSVPSTSGGDEGSDILNNNVNAGIVSLTEGSDSNSNGNQRQAWNRPVSSVVETALVMGADSWPSLSETANAPQRPPIDYSRTASEGSVIYFSQASSSRDQVSHSVRPNSTQNGHRGRHSSTRNNTHRSSTGYSNRTQQQHPPSSQSSYNNSHPDAHAGQNNGHRSQTNTVNNHPHQRSNNGPHLHEDSCQRCRNVGRGAPDANSHLTYNFRAGPVQPPIFPGPLPRPALHVPPYSPPPPPFPPMQFMPSGIHPLTGQPFFYVPPMVGPLQMRPHPLHAPLGPPFIVADLMKQIDYYFSEDSLAKDVYLRGHMDDQGWVSVTIIATFRKVKEITAKQFLDDHGIAVPQFILNVMQNSHFVEVQGDKLRKRSNWKKYILPEALKSSFTAVETPANEVPIANLVLEEKPIHSDSELKVEDEATDDQARQ
ncbi:hypothetical protein QQ045_009027 [Rhodiola kirilowii]